MLELRPIQFDEIRRSVADIAPDQREDLEGRLAPIDWRGDPFTQMPSRGRRQLRPSRWQQAGLAICCVTRASSRFDRSRIYGSRRRNNPCR